MNAAQGLERMKSLVINLFTATCNKCRIFTKAILMHKIWSGVLSYCNGGIGGGSGDITVSLVILTKSPDS